MIRSATKVRVPKGNAWAANDERIRFLKARGLPMSVAWDEKGAVIDAYVTSATAARILAPLGAEAVGKFRTMPNNMVAIEAIVAHDIAIEMLAALGNVA